MWRRTSGPRIARWLEIVGQFEALCAFAGTLAAINTALDGMSFVPTAGFSGIGGISITTNDLGNSGSGGALSTTDSIQVEMVTETRVKAVTLARSAIKSG